MATYGERCSQGATSYGPYQYSSAVILKVEVLFRISIQAHGRNAKRQIS